MRHLLFFGLWLVYLTTGLQGQGSPPTLSLEPEPQTSQAPLAVTRFWFPFPFTDQPQPDIIFHTYGVGPDALYVSAIVQYHRLDPAKRGNVGALFKVSLPDLKTKEIPLPPDQSDDLHNLPEAFDITPEVLYATTRGDGDQTARLQRYDSATQSWTSHDLPPTRSYNFLRLNDTFYFWLATLDGKPSPSGGMPSEESGVACYDWDTGDTTLLASSRRRPAQNQLDDRQPYHVTGIFAGPRAKPCATTPAGTLYIQNQPGPWPEVFDGSWFDQTLTVLGKTLVFNLAGEVTLIDSQKLTPEAWMAAREPIYRKQPTAGSPAVKEQTPWASQTIWDAPEKGVYIGPGVIGFHDDFLFILRKPPKRGGLYDLLCYQKGHGRSPRHIPLDFKLDDQEREVLSLHKGQIPNGWKIDDIEHPDTTIIPAELMTTDQGLGFRLMMSGFWFLPYADIEAYLTNHRITD
jgi:hypothetical protein